MKVSIGQGYVELVEHWGSDERVIEAARMSTGKGFLGWGPNHRKGCPDGRASPEPPEVQNCGCAEPGDEKLLKYLWEHQHSTPFEMGGLTVEVKAPIMVMREFMRHRTLSFNEMSARYIPLPDDNYFPSVERVLLANQGTTNKQAQGSGAPLTEQDALDWLKLLGDLYDHAQRIYEDGLEAGIPKELARLVVPVGRYSVMRASGNLLNWLKFLKLRCDTAAQFEIRACANVIADFVGQKFPHTYEVAKASLGLP